jgi:two-component system, OmpR family, response regulator
MRVLIVEDNEPIAASLVEALTQRLHLVDVATDGLAGLDLVEAFEYDMILLDVMLPKLDGIGFCQKLRQRGYHTPVLMLTAKDTLADKIEGLDAGADDYLAKPFAFKELEARMRALARRPKSTLPPIMVWELLQLNPSTYEASYGEASLNLTPREYSLLELFISHPQTTFSRHRIIERLWMCEDYPGEETVKMHIKRLRQKLKIAGAAEDFIETVYGLGYKLKQKT